MPGLNDNPQYRAWTVKRHAMTARPLRPADTVQIVQALSGG